MPKPSPIVGAQMARLDALLAYRAGELDQALARWSGAIAAAAGAGAVFDEAVLRLELFEHAPEHPDALRGLDQSLETFTALRAVPWIARARRARYREDVNSVPSNR